MLKPEKRFRQPLFWIVVAFALAKLAFMFRYHLPIWDEAVYLGMGKYLYSFGNAGLWEIIRPPALPLLTGFVWKLHLPQILFSELVSVLFGIGSIVLCCLVAERVFGRKVAILSAALLAASPLFFLYSSYVLTEIPASFFILASIYAFIRNRYYLCGSLAAIAMLFKFPNGLLLFVLVAAAITSAIVEKKKKASFSLVKVFLLFLAVTLPFLVFNYLFYRPFTSNIFDAVFRPYILGAWHQSNPSKAIASPLYNYAFYLVQALKQHFVFVFALAVLFLFWKKRWFSDSGKLLLGIFLAVYLTYFTYILNKDERFLILFLPAICIFSAAALIECLSWSQRRARFLFGALIALLVASISIALFQDAYFYTWRSAQEPVVASELYRSITNLGIHGPVLTSEPVFVAYNDNLFFPYYFTSYQGFPAELKPLNEWERNKPFEGVIFSPQSLYCGDMECETARSNLPIYLNSKFRQAFNGSYYRGAVSYTIFINQSYRRYSKGLKDLSG